MKNGTCQAWYSHEEAAAIINPEGGMFNYFPHIRSVTVIRTAPTQTLLEFDMALPELVEQAVFKEIDPWGGKDAGTQSQEGREDHHRRRTEEDHHTNL